MVTLKFTIFLVAFAFLIGAMTVETYHLEKRKTPPPYDYPTIEEINAMRDELSRLRKEHEGVKRVKYKEE